MGDKEWHSQIARWLATDQVIVSAEEVAQLCNASFQCSSTQILSYPASGGVQLLADTSPSNTPASDTNSKYRDGAYLLDPMFTMGRQSSDGTVLQLSTMLEQELAQLDYYQTFFRLTGIRDEVCVIARASTAMLLISLGRMESESAFSEAELADIGDKAPVINALLHRISQALSLEEAISPLSNQMDQALEHFGCSVLTAREVETLHLMLKGHSIKSLADHLHISIDTVKHHRKNIYAKLELGSQAELFDLFVSSVREYNPAINPDPLASLPAER